MGKVKFIKEYVCKYAGDKEDVDCAKCTGQTFMKDGKEVLCKEFCPSCQAGDKEFNISYEDTKIEIDGSTKGLLVIAIIFLILIGIVIFNMLNIENYEQEAPGFIKDLLSTILFYVK